MSIIIIQDHEGDYVKCGAFLSLLHPVRVKTGQMECQTLITIKSLPCACPGCGQWRS